MCLHRGVHHNIVFVNDDPFDIVDMIMKQMKNAERLVFINYSVYVDNDTIDKMFVTPFDHYNCLVFPCVTEGIKWEAFKTNLNTTEPASQIALDFDTTLGQKVGDSLYRVTKTDPKCWIMDTKQVLRSIRDRKSGVIKLPAKHSEMFASFIEKGVKICAYTACRLTVTYSHECLSNILESAGVRAI